MDKNYPESDKSIAAQDGAETATLNESPQGAEAESSLTPNKPVRTDVGGKRVAVSRLSGILKSCVLTGTNKLQQSVTNEKMIIDETWIVSIEDCIHSMENIVKHPKTFIKEERDLVAMERARSTDREAVRHLSSHSEHVRSVADDGKVIPKKLLVKFRSEDYAIYENRVTYTLIKNLKRFIEERYTAIKDLIKFYEVTSLNLDSKFDFGLAKIHYKLDMDISQRMDNANKCQELLERLERIRKRVQIMDNSSFARELKNAKLVKPPLSRTNLLTKNVDYRNVYNLWLFISSFKEVGYTVEVTNKVTPFDDVYTNDLTGLVAESIRIMIRNNTINKEQYKGVKIAKRTAKKFLMIKKVTPKLEKQKQPDMLPTDKGINQFYFDKLKQQFDRQLSEGKKKKAAKGATTALKETQTIDSTFKRFAKSLTRVNLTVLDDITKRTSKDKAKKTFGAKPRTPIDSARLKLSEEQEVEKNYEILISLKEEELEALKNKRQKTLERIQKQSAEIEAKILRAQQMAERKEQARLKALERKALQKKREEEKKAKEKQKALEKKEREKAKAALQKEKEKAQKEKEKAQKEKAKEKEKAQKEKAGQSNKGTNKGTAKEGEKKPATKKSGSATAKKPAAKATDTSAQNKPADNPEQSDGVTNNVMTDEVINNEPQVPDKKDDNN